MRVTDGIRDRVLGATCRQLHGGHHPAEGAARTVPPPRIRKIQSFGSSTAGSSVRLAMNDDQARRACEGVAGREAGCGDGEEKNRAGYEKNEGGGRGWLRREELGRRLRAVRASKSSVNSPGASWRCDGLIAASARRL